MTQEYLTDEELSALIEDVEQHDMVTAPPALRGAIVDAIESLEKKNDKIVEFRRFKARVIAAVAAIVILVMIMPEISGKIPEREAKAWEETHVEIQEKETFNLGESHIISSFINKR